ncbi:MAG: hypothetical protein M3Q69_11570 [Acidobacteriota bacterium]|nr:hypothetical protein [Acidobacteriota bacterium]
MTAPELVECANCDCWFAAASLDDFFYHASSGCCRDDLARPTAATDAAVHP